MKAARVAGDGSPYGDGRAAVRNLDIVRNYCNGAAA